MSSASRGLAPREGLECLLVKMGRTGPLAEPRRGLQAGKSGDPRSQNTDRNWYSAPAGARLVPAWPWSSWLTSREPHEVPLALISPLLASQPSEAAPEEVLCRPPREA